MNNNEKIEEVIAESLENLSSLDGAEKAKEVQSIDILYRINLEQAKIEQAEAETQAKTEREKAKVKEETKQNLIKSCTEVVKTVIPLTIYVFCYSKGLKFEETGAFTSQTFKGLLSKVKFF